MTPPRSAAVVLAVVIVAACFEDPQVTESPTSLVATSSPTATESARPTATPTNSVDPFAVPGTIDVAYARRVTDATDE